MGAGEIFLAPEFLKGEIKMVPAAWLIGAGLVGMLGVAAIVYNWDGIMEWLHDFIPRVSQMLRAASVEFGPEFKAAAMMVGGLLDSVHAKIEHKLYHKVGHGKWLEETTRRTLPESELPPAIRNKIRRNRQDADITDEMEMELGMSI